MSNFTKRFHELVQIKGYLMTDVEWFRFTPKGGSERVQEIRVANLRVVADISGKHRVEIWIKTTRPGETSDDRGVEKWDAPVIVAFTTDPLTLPEAGQEVEITEAIDRESVWERFLYY